MTTDPTPIAPPLAPAPPTDDEVADLVHRLGVDTLDAIAEGAHLGRLYVSWGRPRAHLEHVGPAVTRAAALAAFDEATGR